jgi:hypothetical protein
MSKVQEKKSKTNKASNQEAIINMDINNPNSYLHQFWFTDNIVGGTIIVNNNNVEHHTVDIDALKEVIIDDTNNNKTK